MLKLSGSPNRSRWLYPLLYLAAVAFFIIAIGSFHRRNTGFTVFIRFGDQFSEKALPAVRDAPHYVHFNSAGYDGQWYAQLAVEPLLHDRAIDRALDTPPYRARRIFFSWTAYLFGLGRPAWVLKAYALQNIVAWVLLAMLFARWLPPTRSRHFAAWFGCLFGAGLIGSVTHALLEGPSLLLLTLAVLAVERGRFWVASVVMALSGLGRETNLVGAGVVVGRLPRDRDALMRLAGQLAIMVVPYLLWSLYVRSLYPSFRLSNPDSFGLPFSAYVQKWASTIGELFTYGWQTDIGFSLAALVSLTTQAAFLIWHREPKSAWWRMGVPYVVLLPFLSALVWAGYPGAAIRVLVPMTIAFNVLIVESRSFWRLVVVGNLSVIEGLLELSAPFVARLIG